VVPAASRGKSIGNKRYDAGSWRNRKKGSSSHRDEDGFWREGKEQ
jgi:hypothetical protein